MSQHRNTVQSTNTALRMLLDEAEMSNTGLASVVVAAGAKEGIHLGTDTTSVRRMLDGSQPHWPTPRLVAATLSRRLRREVTVTDCGFADRTPPDEDPHEGLTSSGTLEGTVRTVVELSGRDMRRRKLLLGSVFSAAAFAEPALVALTVPPTECTTRAAGRHIGMADVEILIQQVVHLGQLDHRYGAGRVREQVVALLHREANELLHGTYSEKTGRALLTAVSKLTRLAGYTAADIGRHALAQRYYIQGLDLTMRAGNRAYAAEILSEMSRMTLLIGQNTLTDHDRFRHGRQAAALARAGLTIAQSTAAPVLVAELHAMDGRALALLGDTRGARQAVLTAQRLFDSLRPDDETPVFYSDAAIASELGRCLHDIGEPEQAITMSTTALRDYEPWRVRNRCWVQTDLASAHVLHHDLEQAAALGRDALRTAAEVSSPRLLDRLRTLQRQVRPLRSASPHLADLDTRITDFLTRTIRRHQDDAL
ncbi:MAG: hypothetical protein ACRDTG_12185 [Pseudonocardiaceae bacterium]